MKYIFMCLFCSAMVFGQNTDDKHQFWIGIELNQSIDRKVIPTIRTVDISPSFSAGLSYQLLLLKKARLYAIANIKYRRQVYKSEFFFTPHLFMNREDVNFGRISDFKVDKKLHTIIGGLGLMYELPTKSKTIVWWIIATGNMQYLLDKSSGGRRGRSTVSLDYLGSSYVGVISDGYYYFAGETVWFSGNFQLGLTLNKQSEHPVRIGLGYTFGPVLGVIEYESYNYLGDVIGRVEDYERLQSIDFSIGIKF